VNKILIFFLLVPTIGSSQLGRHLPLEIGNAWYFDNYPSLAMHVVADTMIAGRSYKLIASSIIFGNFCIREDSSRVYRYKNFSATDELIYDFTRNAGDTLSSDSTGGFRICTQNALVQYVGKTRRQWDFAYGIGSPCVDCVAGETLVDSIGWRECWSASYTLTLTRAILGGQMIITGVSTEARTAPSTLAASVYPNPFNSSTVLAYSLPRAGNLRIILFNSLGQKVRVLFDGRSNAGDLSLSVDGSDLSSGLYFCRLVLDDMTEVTKLVLLK
jgi:hypothetical protein